MRQRAWLLFCAGGSFIISLAAATLTEWLLTNRIPLVGSVIGLQKAHNLGITFGIGLGPLQTAFIIIALALVAAAAWRTPNSRSEQAGFGLIVGGGLANLIDRLIDGYVTDMIQIGSFPVFNIADACINLGVAVLLIGLLKKKIEN